MEVYVVTQPENGWDCVVGVCLSIHSLRKYCEEILEEPKHAYIHCSLEELKNLLYKRLYILHIIQAN